LTIKEKKNKKKTPDCGTKSAFSISSTFFGAEPLKAQAVTKKKVVQKTKLSRKHLRLKALGAWQQRRWLANLCLSVT